LPRFRQVGIRDNLFVGGTPLLEMVHRETGVDQQLQVVYDGAMLFDYSLESQFVERGPPIG
jgi:hypothetical protein